MGIVDIIDWAGRQATSRIQQTIFCSVQACNQECLLGRYDHVDEPVFCQLRGLTAGGTWEVHWHHLLQWDGACHARCIARLREGCVAPAAESALTPIGLPLLSHLPAAMSYLIFLQSDFLCPLFWQYLYSPSNLVAAFSPLSLPLPPFLDLPLPPLPPLPLSIREPLPPPCRS